MHGSSWAMRPRAVMELASYIFSAVALRSQQLGARDGTTLGRPSPAEIGRGASIGHGLCCCARESLR